MWKEHLKKPFPLMEMPLFLKLNFVFGYSYVSLCILLSFSEFVSFERYSLFTISMKSLFLVKKKKSHIIFDERSNLTHKEFVFLQRYIDSFLSTFPKLLLLMMSIHKI